MSSNWSGGGGGNASLTAPLTLPATYPNGFLMTQGGNGLDDGKGDMYVKTKLTIGNSLSTPSIDVTSSTDTSDFSGAVNISKTTFCSESITANGGIISPNRIISITVPASGVAIPAFAYYGTDVNCLTYIVGGVITEITLNEESLPTSIPMILQHPTDDLIITYTTAPTAIYQQML